MTSRRIRGAALALGFALLSAGSAQAATVRYADPAGDDSDPTCPQLDPCDLETALEDPSVNPADVVMVAAGAFALSNELTIDDAIEVIGAGPFASAINSSANPALRVQASGAAVHGVQINTSASNGVGVRLLGASTGDGLFVSGSGAACRLDDQATLRDSACWNPDPGGFSAITVDSLVGTPSLTLSNVTAYAAGSSAQGLHVFADTTNVTVNVSNSIFRTPSGGGADVHAGADAGTADVFVDHSSYSDVSLGTASTVTPAGTGTNILAPPLFVDAVAGDFHQAAGSPTIDQGSSAVSGLSLLDFDGQARTQGANTDMGADEFPSPPLPQPPATTPAPTKKKGCKKKGKRKSAGAAKKRCKKKRKPT